MTHIPARATGRWSGRRLAGFACVTMLVAAVLVTGCAAAPSQGAVGQPAMATSLDIAPETAWPAVTSAAGPSAPPVGTPIPTMPMTPTATPAPTLTPTPLPPLVAIDAGHGGIDLGARHFARNGRMDLYESEVNLSLALRVADLLAARGFRVFLTRDGDFRINGEKDINGDGDVDNIDEALVRVDVLNEASPDLLLSIHQNGHDNSSYSGTTVYYCADRPFSAESLRFATLVHDRTLEAFADLGYDIRDRGVIDDHELKEPGEPGEHIIILGPKTKRSQRETTMPGALTETLFITNDLEATLAADPTALDRLALGYALAIEDYFAPAAH